MFPLAIYCLTTSNLPWFMDLTVQVPMQYCSSQHWILLSSPETSTMSVISALAQLLHSFWSYYRCSLLFPSSILDTSWPGGLVFWRHSSVFFSRCPRGSPGENAAVGCHVLLQWTTLCQNSSVRPVCLGRPCKAWLIAPLRYEAPSPQGCDPWRGLLT